MLRHKTDNIWFSRISRHRPGNTVDLFLQPLSSHGANKRPNLTMATHLFKATDVSTNRAMNLTGTGAISARCHSCSHQWFNTV